MPLLGKDLCMKNLERHAGTEWGNTAQAFRDVALGVVMPECMAQCPVDTGVLRQSIPACSFGEVTARDCRVVIGAGGAARAYALRQHEELTWKHKVGNAKFIERPIRAIQSDIPAMVAARKGALK